MIRSLPPLKVATQDSIAIDELREAAKEYTPSQFQQKIIDCPVDLVLPGGRGGGKSFGVVLRIANNIAQYGRDYRGLYIRQTYDGVEDFEGICQDIFLIFPGAKYNIQKRVWKFPNGARLKIGQLELEKHYKKYQGQSYTELIIDEAGQYSSPHYLDLLVSNLRGRSGMRLCRVIVANPGGAGHQWIYERYIANRPDGEIYYEPQTKRKVMTFNSTYRDNPNIDRQQYAELLETSTANDAELAKAFIDGDWNIARGAYFATVLDRDRSTIPNWASVPQGWTPLIGMDYGTAAPCAIYLAAISPGSTVDDRYYPKDSIALLDELYLCQPNDPSKGLNLTIDRAADQIKYFCSQWRHNPLSKNNIADDAIFASDGRDSIASLFLQEGVRFSPAKKGHRVSGWEHLRTMMRRAGDREFPGFYVSPRCSYFWKLVPLVPRDDRCPSDVDSKANDHIADAARYISLSVRRDEPQEIGSPGFGGISIGR